MKTLIIRKKRIGSQIVEMIFLGITWSIVLVLAFFLVLSYMGVYTDDLAVIFLMIGFPLENLWKVMYLIFASSGCLSLVLLYRMCKGIMEVKSE